jgi:hypothetical protein
MSHAAAADFKGVALTTFLLAVGVGAMLWLAAGIVAEHWLVRGGLPAWARWSWLAVGLTLLAAAAVRGGLPLVRYRVNLVYAARVLEQEHPDLHNDVVNAVLARAHADETTPLVVKSLRRRAAKQLPQPGLDVQPLDLLWQRRRVGGGPLARALDGVRRTGPRVVRACVPRRRGRAVLARCDGLGRQRGFSPRGRARDGGPRSRARRRARGGPRGRTRGR